MIIMIIRFIFSLIFLVVYATARTAREVREIPGQFRLSQNSYPSYNIIAPDGPGTYAFGYEIEDALTGNVQFKDEEKLRNGTVKGSYGLLRPDGTVFITRYIADIYGFRSKQEIRRPGTKTEVSEQNIPFNKPTSLTPDQIQANIHVVSEPSTTVAVPVSLSPQAATTVAYPVPFPTQPTYFNPNMVNQMRRQFQVDPNPTYNPIYDDNYVSPELANSILGQYPNVYDLRQSGVSNYQNNRPFTFPFLSWLNPNQNNNQYYNGNYQSNYQNDATNPQQPGPVVSFIQGIPNAIQNFAQNNPVTQLWNGIWGQNTNNNMNQNQNGFWNLFNQNRPSTYNNMNNMPVPASVQSDYVPPVHNNFDSTVFSTDLNGNYKPQINPMYNSQTNPMYGSNYASQNAALYGNNMRPQNSAMYGNNYLQYLTNQNQNGQPYQFQNPYLTQLLGQRPGNYYNYNSNRTRNKNRKSNKKKNKNRDYDDDYDSDSSSWFDDFLERRKRLNLDSNGIETTTLQSTDE